MSLVDWKVGRALVGLVPPERAQSVRGSRMRFDPPAPRTPAVPMVEIIMLETCRGAPTSTTTVLYEAGKTYLVPEDLARSFFSCCAADPAEAHAACPQCRDRPCQCEAHTQPVQPRQEAQEAPAYPQASVAAPEPKNSRHRPRHGRGKAS